MNINIAQFSYTRAFENGPHDLEPWSSDEDETWAGTLSPNYHTTRDIMNKVGEIPRMDDRGRNILSPPPQFRHSTEREENILCTRDSDLKTFGPTDLTSTYSVCTCRIFGGIGHRAQAFRSGVRCPNH
ncbi:hypothetical protein TNCV_2102101 [Trichonephila clavipes]|nr:hypothetical protein TNCV_2102101 [Trichonephila clavipes]